MSTDRGSGHRVQVTVFLEAQVHQAAKKRATDMKLSLSATVADAAKESLLSSYRSEREQEILKAAERNFYAVKRMEQRFRLELAVLKELVGLGMRSFFNHTPPVPEPNKAAALLSGKQRFGRYLDLVASNLRGGHTVLGDIPAFEPKETVASSGAADESNVVLRQGGSPPETPVPAADSHVPTLPRVTAANDDPRQATLFGRPER